MPRLHAPRRSHLKHLPLDLLPFLVLAFIPVFGALIGFLAFPVGGIALVGLWIMGLIVAVNGQQKPMPVVGEYFQKWFGNAFD